VEQKKHSLQAFSMGIDTHQEPVAYMREDCHVCRSEGFSSNARIMLVTESKELIVTLNVVRSDKLSSGQIGLSDIAIKRLDCVDGQAISISHAPVIASLSYVRKKIFGGELTGNEIMQVIEDISNHKYSDIEIASFLSACAGQRLSIDEIVHLTKAMVSCGKTLNWGENKKIFDKHCIGGLPGNRTTPLVVSIASAAGLIIPKTSSRAITSPAGTADTMQSLANVSLNIDQIEKVVSKTGACLAWGGAVNLSPADDMLIRIERSLDLDGEGQLIASVLSKKIAAGSTHVLIDIPVGDTAKVRSHKDADRLAELFNHVGAVCGIEVRCLITDGSKPVGAGIGPSEEAKDILAVLNCNKEAPEDLRERALFLSANLFDMNDGLGIEAGLAQATTILESGQALTQFNKILEEQGGRKVLSESSYKHIEISNEAGVLTGIDNRKIARLAKLAGAPFSLNSGLRLHVNVDSLIAQGSALFTLYSDSQGEMNYALDYYHSNNQMFQIED
jgi:thymidine phosphorylase